MTDKPFKPRKQGAVLIRLLKDRPHAVGAEIGVNFGETFVQLLRGLPNLELIYAVDPWCAYPEYKRVLAEAKWRTQEAFDEVFKRFLTRILPLAHRVSILRAFSTAAARVLRDGSLDFVFIDGNHSYEYVRDDIAAWAPKVKQGGLIAGHDYLAHPKSGENWGVIEAVNERFPNVHTEPHHVWWVEKG